MAMTIWSEIERNKRKSLLLIITFAVLLFALSYALGRWYLKLGEGSIVFAIILSIVITALFYYSSPRLVVIATGAKEADPKKWPHYVNTVEGLAIAAGVPRPRAYVIEDQAINAYATGHNPSNALVVVTTGALEKLSRLELEGVVAHEIAHIRNYDIRLMTIAAAMVGAVGIISDLLIRSRRIALIGLVLAALSPIFSLMIFYALSRQREYLADASAALLTRYPEGLASALEKISRDKSVLRHVDSSTAHLFISNPIRNKFFGNLFDTHPPLKERIQRLRAM